MYRFLIKGVVQGVGFRPYMYNACVKAGLTGYIQNIGEGVVVDVDNKDKFLLILKKIPELARIDSYEITKNDDNYNSFQILESTGQGYAEIPPDLFLCNDCYEELNDEHDRRHKYFFITCTNCGPRFSITKKNPYDRATTTMDKFPMCEKCKKEYTDPTNRRYHAETIACHDCGPKLYLLEDGQKISLDDNDAIMKATTLIKNNELVAIKGVGGFHIACNMAESTLKKLREVSKRADKPYAIMCKDLTMARKIVGVNKYEEILLSGVQRPIIALKKIQRLNHVSELETIGVMLPYTALHYLLFDYIDEPIVMTSSNMTDEPITKDDQKQFVKYILSHNRVIENSIDDSVVKIIEKKPIYLRRSRGFVPESIKMPKSSEHILAMGAELNNTFCVYKDGKATLSEYMGTTSNLKTMDNYKLMVEKFLQFTDTKPTIIIADMHPEYQTTKYAEELSQELGARLVKVQHHKAHAYSAAAEHDLKDFVSIVCDGLGYGEDGNIWGGEIFYNDKRVGHLEEQWQLGGDSATIYPAKMLLSILWKFMDLEQSKKHLQDYFDEKQLLVLHKQYEKEYNCPITTSTGRILDAAAFLLGFCSERTYEGRPAMLLDELSLEPYEIEPVIIDNILMTTPLFECLVKNIDKDKRRLAATVEIYIAKGLLKIAKQYNKPIVFTGGCACSNVMTSFMIRNKVLINQKIPCGDGGISFGQIAYYLKKVENQ